MALSTFSNGLRLNICEMPELNTATVCVNLVGGYQGEMALYNGMCEMISRLILCGTKTYPTKMELNRAAKQHGLVIKTTCEVEFLQIEINCLKNKIDKAIEFAYDIIFNSNFDDADILSIKNQMKAEIELNKLNPTAYLNQLTNQSMFARTGLTNTKLGNLKSIDRITKDMLLAQLSRYISPKNIVISVGGAVQANTVLELVNNSFYLGTKNMEYKQIKYVSQVLDFEGFINIKNRPYHQSRVQISFPSMAFKSEDKYAMQLIAKPLENYLKKQLGSERYFKSLVVFNECYANNGKFVFEVIADSENVEEFLQKLLSEIKGVLANRERLSSEFKAEKNAYITEYVLNSEKADNLVKLCANELTLAKKEYLLSEAFASLADVTYDDAMDVLEEVIDFSKINIAYLGKPVRLEFLRDLILN
ncbi:MAG: insulinase family protein [Clostridia bacterium]|nr:insulinase family protein [Clostridia bacterium]